VSPPTPDRAPTASPPSPSSPATERAFCHTFDLTKRLSLSTGSPITFIPPPAPNSRGSPFSSILQDLTARLSSSPSTTIHRLVIPNLLSPAIYHPQCSNPEHLLQFLHALRGLLRQYSTQLTAMITFPLEIYPRSAGLVRWVELLSDGVLELAPFPHLMDVVSSIATSGAATSLDDQPQGMLKVHRLPVFHEKGGGGGASSGLGEDLAFTVSRRKFVIKPFSLPPLEGDTEAQQGGLSGGEGKQTKVDIAF